MGIAKKTYRIRNTDIFFKVEGAVTSMGFEFGSSCGKQDKPSVAVRGVGQSGGVLTQETVQELAEYFTYWAKVMDDPTVLGEGNEWVNQTFSERIASDILDPK